MADGRFELVMQPGADPGLTKRGAHKVRAKPEPASDAGAKP